MILPIRKKYYKSYRKKAKKLIKLSINNIMRIALMWIKTNTKLDFRLYERKTCQSNSWYPMFKKWLLEKSMIIWSILVPQQPKAFLQLIKHKLLAFFSSYRMWNACYSNILKDSATGYDSIKLGSLKIVMSQLTKTVAHICNMSPNKTYSYKNSSRLLFYHLTRKRMVCHLQIIDQYLDDAPYKNHLKEVCMTG